MYKAIFFGLALSLSLSATGQQIAQYTQFFSNKLVLNPAYAGSRDALSIVGLVRSQWTGFTGAPNTQTLTVHTPFARSTSGIGLTLLHDRIGITDNLQLTGSYAFRIDLGKNTHLALGISGEIQRRQMDWAASNPLDVDDAAIPWTQRNLVLPNFGAGIYLHSRRFYLGASAPRMLETELNYYPSGSNLQSLALLRRHFFGMAGLNIPLAVGVELRPQVLVKYVANAPVEFDLNLGLLLKERFWFGGTLRTQDSFDVFFQYWINQQFRFGYAFDLTLTRLNPYNYGSHEIMLGIDLGRRRKGLVHPRYF
ncbi:MAG: type IX secretion system membrane protein PorP/SprF [Bacteroidota bacterium]